MSDIRCKQLLSNRTNRFLQIVELQDNDSKAPTAWARSRISISDLRRVRREESYHI